MSTYFLIGLWTYVVLAIARFDGVLASRPWPLIKGFVFCLLFWPLSLLAMFLYHIIGKGHTDEQS